MRTIAGVSGKRRKDIVLSMLDKQQHRAKSQWNLIESDVCTMGTDSESTNGNDFSTRAYISDGRLFLQRDPLGITPLYYGFTSDGLLCFASEVKALVDLTRDVHELLPGTTFDGQAGKTYYRVSPQQASDDSADELAAELRGRLNDAVKQYVSQDTMGSWLSGGLDSSTIVALARPHVKKLHTFVAGLPGAPDLDAARTVADFVRTEHHEVVVSAQDLLKLLPTVIYHLESFDALLVRSSLTNFIAGKAAADYVSEVFSGEGGDELFAGYAYLKSLPPAELSGELIDITNRLHNTALQRVDRCASAHGLTPCVCFLNLPVVDLALKTPVEYKLKDGLEKWILRQAIDGLLPQQIVSRPKAKFWEGAGVGELISEEAERRISDADFAHERKLPNGWMLSSKEELMYYRIFRDHFGVLDNLAWMGRSKGAGESE